MSVEIDETDVRTRELLEQLAERFDALADLAHKINNPLTSVMGRAQLLRMTGPTDPDVLKAVQVIDEATVRITAYVREVARIVRDGREVISARTSGADDQTGAETAAR